MLYDFTAESNKISTTHNSKEKCWLKMGLLSCPTLKRVDHFRRIARHEKIGRTYSGLLIFNFFVNVISYLSFQFVMNLLEISAPLCRKYVLTFYSLPYFVARGLLALQVYHDFATKGNYRTFHKHLASLVVLAILYFQCYSTLYSANIPKYGFSVTRMFSYKDGIIDFVIIRECVKQTKTLQRNGAIITHCVKYARIPVLSHFYIPLKGRNRRTESLKTRILANFTQCVMINPFRNKVFYNYFNIVLCDIWILFYFQLDMNSFLFRFNRSRNSSAENILHLQKSFS